MSIRGLNIFYCDVSTHFTGGSVNPSIKTYVVVSVKIAARRCIFEVNFTVVLVPYMFLNRYRTPHPLKLLVSRSNTFGPCNSNRIKIEF